MKLGKRLKHIAAMVTPDYDHIWDCCCDHGLLGAALLARQVAPCIHFVDIVPEIMAQVESKLRRFHPQPSESADPQWLVHCLDVSLLPLQQFKGRHLVIIAGIGGELVADLVKVIYRQHPAADIDFLLCPVHHEFLLRKTLIELDFSLKTECLMEENRRFYEVLLVSTNRHADIPHQPINPVGSLIWQSTQAEQAKIAADYLHKTLQHYKKIQRNPTSDVQHIIDAYSAVRF